MGTVLGDATRENTRYTVFENNQVLTADQLNDLFNYLQVQTRLTRARAIGVGIAGGLEIGVTENNAVVLSKGVAITTDGDLLHLDNDTAFTDFVLYDDSVAQYPLFRTGGNAMIPLFELLPENTQRSGAARLSTFSRATNTTLNDYVGMLYLEDHLHDPDLCTGTDCDNKGTEHIRQLKVLIAHKDEVRALLATIPKLNQNYFALEDIYVPRVKIRNTITQFSELSAAFQTVLNIRNEIKTRLARAYEVCKPLVEDEFNGADPVAEWNNLLDAHFERGTTIYAQYVYDFARDLAAAYNEMRENFFGDNSLLCPPIALFPKHVLLGEIRTAVVTRPLIPPLTRPNVTIPVLNLLRNIRFDPGALIRRFQKASIDVEFRHDFYPSPALNSEYDTIERIRFHFTRLNALIRNFRIPTAEELQSVQRVRITPSQSEDHKLGKRSIPFYYQANRSFPVNAYWDYEANIRRREDQLLSYHAGSYSNHPAVVTPIDFNLLPFSFFRIEGHIGFKYQEVERILNNIINENNLPINLMTVQVERELRTIPNRDWFFPHLQVYSQLARNSFVDQLQQAEMIHPALQRETANDEEAPRINLSIQNFNNAKAKVLNNAFIGSNNFDAAKFSQDVSDVIKASTEVKAQTKKFTFSNTAIPHDFVINTDILHKADYLNGLFADLLNKKKEELMLGNFMKSNPGLEHAGGVLRGGTFVLVYRSNDDVVVADFMLPYANVDKDIVKDPPVIRPLPLPIPKVELPKIFERIPPYKVLLDDRIKGVDDRLKGYDDKFKIVDENINTKLNLVEVTKKLFDDKIANVDKRIGEVDVKYSGKLQDFDRKLDYHGDIFDKITKLPTRNVTPDKGNIVVNGRDLTREAAVIKRLKEEVAATQPNTPDRQQKETQLASITNNFLGLLNQPNVTIDKEREADVKALLFDVQESKEVIQDPGLKQQVDTNINIANRNIRVIFK